ncbi:DUF155-domain-containing protein [Clavulina sp. PMI_390]|nr:DUF155-domain-containing protein [Clavulina sp. PMI_390]
MASKPILPTSQTNPAGRSSPDQKSRGAVRRTTKAAHKLKVLPEQPEPPTQSKIVAGEEDGDGDDEDDEEEEVTASESDADDDEDDVELYKQIAHIPAGTARKDALRLTKKEKAKLPRATAYCTASSYRLADLQRFFNARRSSHRTDVKQFDDVLYTPYSYDGPLETIAPASQAEQPAIGDLLGASDIPFSSSDGTVVPSVTNDLNRRALEGDLTLRPRRRVKKKFDKIGGEHSAAAEVFVFEFGVVVCWGMTEPQEKRFLSSIRRFEVERLPPDEVEYEDLNFYYANYSRIYNDVITLRRGSSYMTKLSLSHALAQSVKISLFEDLISNTIDETKNIPETISETGKIGMDHGEIMQQIGSLFILRMNINLVGSVLDSPELFWSYPDLQPLYDAARSYLEIPQRIDLLNTRVEVLQDMLSLLKESVQSKHAERLEQIVIALIGIEIVLGVITILVDLFSAA